MTMIGVESRSLLPSSSPCGHGPPPAGQDSQAGRTLARLAIGTCAVSLLMVMTGAVTDQAVLLTEGIHNVADAVAYVVAWNIHRLSRGGAPDHDTYPFGYGRLTVLGGFFSGCFLAAAVLFTALDIVDAVAELTLGDDRAGPALDTSVRAWTVAVGALELLFNASVLAAHSSAHAHAHDDDDPNTKGGWGAAHVHR
ncbi:hypothetical protein PBRA_004147 [Plasmodiophora brassicae]|uniref:Cation efflux protein transmembrane domain-containing protein n=1 Tax=Plasmodiophora brassicae TaxID=37360 RepID=A0A0G4IJK6_PLABS|nr:hypothetical protein PBRA_004147 [Plasmodiophora brassicae]